MLKLISPTTKTKTARELAAGDHLFSDDEFYPPIREVKYANGKDGREAKLTGGETAKTAYAIRAILEDGQELFFHPNKTIRVAV